MFVDRGPSGDGKLHTIEQEFGEIRLWVDTDDAYVTPSDIARIVRALNCEFHPSPPPVECGCIERCGDVDEDDDDPLAVCKLLP